MQRNTDIQNTFLKFSRGDKIFNTCFTSSAEEKVILDLLSICRGLQIFNNVSQNQQRRQGLLCALTWYEND
ncbi:hypothetical protein QJS10_CPB18g01255 [Acorus calamus]|uniref:Uncharacterized protein n=1 Tax=Acorus calamus TaxID=4465 RepID=A0AAV9CP85_ACOCL|nr:hypothetical protein QJS10_CPB18g01255 [Acorus calamus]